MFTASTTRRAGLLALATAGALALSSCATGASAEGTGSGSGAKSLSVVTSTTVYSSLVEDVLGDRGTATALIQSSAQDPHSYEASARDKLSLSKADLVVLNGGGYDGFAEQVVESLPNKPAILEAYEGEGHDHAAESASAPSSEPAHDEHSHEHGNEHVWYDMHLMGEFATRLGDQLAQVDPEGADGYRERAGELKGKLEALEAKVEGLKPQAKGRGYLMTEPVAQSLLEDAGLSNRTPAGLAEAIEEGDEISPLALKSAQEALSAGKVVVLAYNEQTTDEQTASLKTAAEKAGVKVLSVSETPRDGQDYLAWMNETIGQLQDALR